MGALPKHPRELSGEILVNAKSPVKEDVVYVHAGIEGWQNGKLGRKEFVHSYYPQEIAGQTWKAISWTTAGSACAVVEMVVGATCPPADSSSKSRSLSIFSLTHRPARSFFNPILVS